MRIHRRVLIALALIGVGGACQMLSHARDAALLAAQIDHAFHTHSTVTIFKDSVLVVVLQGDSAASRDSTYRVEYEKAVALFAYSRYPRRDALWRVAVTFMARSRFGSVSFRSDGPPLWWPASQLRDEMRRADSATAAPK
jgi:hypothetical protein